jgi:hypothetical protein
MRLIALRADDRNCRSNHAEWDLSEREIVITAVRRHSHLPTLTWGYQYRRTIARRVLQR